MKKYVFTPSIDDDKMQKYFNTNHYSIVSYDDQPLFDFQNDINNSLKNYNITRSGKKNGKLYNSRDEEIGEYNIRTNE